MSGTAIFRFLSQYNIFQRNQSYRDFWQPSHIKQVPLQASALNEKEAESVHTLKHSLPGFGAYYYYATRGQPWIFCLVFCWCLVGEQVLDAGEHPFPRDAIIEYITNNILYRIILNIEMMKWNTVFIPGKLCVFCFCLRRMQIL